MRRSYRQYGVSDLVRQVGYLAFALGEEGDMDMSRIYRQISVGLALAGSLAGCNHLSRDPEPLPALATPLPAVPPVPRELELVSHPAYVIEPPDILLIDAVRLIPKPPYRIAPLDSIVVQVTGLPPEEPITGTYGVEPDGRINLGFSYGSIEVAGLTTDQAVKEITTRLQEAKVKAPQVRVSTGQISGYQQIRGEHLVRPDGTVALGNYGSAYVTGLTLEQAKQAIEGQLAKFLRDPEVSVDVAAYNSKTYYVIADGGGLGEQVYRFPSTGKETVLDAVSQINGLPAVASKSRIWLARPAPGDATCMQILPINWSALTRGGATATNYQVLPGDRIFLDSVPLVRFDTKLARIFSPIERVFGITLLGSSTYHSLTQSQNSNTGSGVNR
jgi:polysaccharide biosynthesis/export protein